MLYIALGFYKHGSEMAAMEETGREGDEGRQTLSEHSYLPCICLFYKKIYTQISFLAEMVEMCETMTLLNNGI